MLGFTSLNRNVFMKIIECFFQEFDFGELLIY